MFYKIKCPYETLNIPRNGESFRCWISDLGFRHVSKTKLKRKVPTTHKGDKHYQNTLNTV